MPETRPMRLAIIGLGMAAKPHIAALRQLQETIEVAGVFTRTAEKRALIASQTGWREFESIDEICKAPDVDGAIVITPPNARLEIVKKLAGAGKHILMEKPVERSFAAAKQIVDLCIEKDVRLGIVLQHRFRAGAIALSELVNSGKLGQIHLARVNVPWWREQSYYDQPGRGSVEMDGGGVLITQAIHVLDLMLSIAGPAKSVNAMTGTTPLHHMETEDFACVGLRFHSGAMGSILATTASYPGGAESLHLDTEHAAVSLTAGELIIHWRDGRSETIGEVTGTGGGRDPMDFPCDWHRDLIADFANAWRDGTDPAITGKEALSVHALIDAIHCSSKSGQQEEVETLNA